jgi:HAD superfamily hydrolase (TIGR01490 family)
MGLIAVFDFDGTLIKRDSMVLLFLKHFRFSFMDLYIFFKISAHAARFFLKSYSRKRFKEIYLNLVTRLSGFRYNKDAFAEFADYLRGIIFPEAVKEINRLKKKGYKTILLSASPDLYLDIIGKALGFSNVICTRTINEDGVIRIKGLNCYGKNKIEMLLNKFPRERINWDLSFCYTDSPSDEELLGMFGNPLIVNNKDFARKSTGARHVNWK